jgi:regulator of cell morphogenesis and NO signaling
MGACPFKTQRMLLLSKIFGTSDTTLSEMIKANPLLLLVVDNFGIENFDRKSTVNDVCAKQGINSEFFLLVCNLHNGFYTNNNDLITQADLPAIIEYLKRGHDYYKSEKYPEIVGLIHEMCKNDTTGIMSVIETYFNEYFEEVVEHIDYEENIAFPYFLGLLGTVSLMDKANYSTGEYQEHHTDIESKLETFKDFFLHHVSNKKNTGLKRKLLISIGELEFILKIHAHIEDTILIPLTSQLEK